MTGRAYQAPALEKGLAIIQLLSAEQSGLSMMGIARALGRSHNEIYRMILVLEQQGYVIRTPEDQFALSGKLFDLAMRQPRRRNLHDAALPMMHRLANSLWQSCHLAVLSETDIVVVARVESPDLLGFAVRVGYRRPIIESTSGRVLFSNLPLERRKALRDQIERSGCDRVRMKAFWDLCDQPISGGVVVGPSMTVTSITDIGAPIFDGTGGGAVASLTVPFVSGTVAHTSLEEAGRIVSQTARTISRALELEAA
jgi:DNA-binding IclR family transcriptional regulator